MMKRRRFGTPDQYADALRDALAESPEKVLEILRAHYEAPRQTRTYSQLAASVGYANHGGVNAQYGRLARRVASRLGVVARPEERFWGIVLVDWAGPYDPRCTRFRLRPEVVEALNRLQLPWATKGGKSDAEGDG